MQHVKTQGLASRRIVPALAQLKMPGFATGVFIAERGCLVESHGHDKVEEIYLLSGRLRLNDTILDAGDMHRVEPGEFTDLEALEDCRFLLMNY
jgi:quercetin dioxygenase-like cupin family protein